MFSRREFLILGSGAAALAIVPGTVRSGTASALPLPGGAAGLDPTSIPKYVTPLPIPSAMPKTAVLPDGIDYYEVAMRQLTQQILPAGMPSTTVWGYGSLVDNQFRHIAKTFEATAGVPVRVKWINQLVDAQGRYLPHILPVDPTLHWANPAGPIDSRVAYTTNPDLYRGPVPMVTHVHGAHTGPESDGYAEAWWLPQANNLAGYTTKGSKYDQYDRSNTTPGSAVFQYPNTQRASAIWYHDHTLGITRLNVYAGPAGYWMIRGGADDLPAGVLPSGTHEVPVVIQDRCFNADGSLWYPDTRDFFDGYSGPALPYLENGIPPYWIPEFFANTMMINGVTWPKLDVEARRYRLRFLNGCGSRFLKVKIVADSPETLTDAASHTQLAAIPMHIIGADGGFLPNVTSQDELLMGPAERFDVIVDFTGLEGHTFYVVNEGPDEPFGGGEGGVDFDISDALSTRQIMQITVGARLSTDTSVPVDQLTLPSRAPLPATTDTRRVSLNELATTIADADGTIVFDGPTAAMLGTVDPLTNMGMPMMWGEAPSETPLLGATEEWEICNFTMDAHPIHLHLVDFEIVGRAPMDTVQDGTGAVICKLPVGGPQYRPPEAWETGVKDTVLAYPGEITRLRARFDLCGLYQWHCHIGEHEDNEMMRPMAVVTNTAVPLGRLAESAIVAAGGGSLLTISSSTVNGLVSAGPKVITALSDATVLDGLRTHTGTVVLRSRGVGVRQGATKADQSGLAKDLASAAAAAKALGGTSLPAVTNSRTILGAGLTVVSVPSITLSGASKALVLRGGPRDQFVINVAGNISLSTGAAIRLDGVLPSQVLFRTAKSLIMSASSAAGTFLVPSGLVTLSRSTITGAVASSGSVVLAASTVNRA
ncbi:MAG: multicopper oxidase domain-containing protein [Actinobacteria bacterium]|nr:multicopper oxidase domain-containing protein [Actinomycetota bacterium]